MELLPISSFGLLNPGILPTEAWLHTAVIYWEWHPTLLGLFL